MKIDFLRGSRPYVAGIVLALAGTAAFTAVAHGGPRGGHGPDAMMMAPPEHLDRMLDRMLGSIDATEAQRSQIRDIARSAMTDLKGQREAGRELRQKSMALFAQPTVDANAVEAARQQMLQQQDQVSRRISQAMLDASRVLTPEQRAQLAERMNKRGEMMRRHHEERRQLDDKPRG